MASIQSILSAAHWDDLDFTIDFSLDRVPHHHTLILKYQYDDGIVEKSDNYISLEINNDWCYPSINTFVPTTMETILYGPETSARTFNVANIFVLALADLDV